jgi:hypothetical protein
MISKEEWAVRVERKCLEGRILSSSFYPTSTQLTIAHPILFAPLPPVRQVQSSLIKYAQEEGELSASESYAAWHPQFTVGIISTLPLSPW